MATFHLSLCILRLMCPSDIAVECGHTDCLIAHRSGCNSIVFATAQVAR